MNAIQLFKDAMRLAVPEDRAVYISERIPDTLSDSGITMWHPGDSIETHGGRVLMGIAPYSRDDLELLELVKETLVRRRPADVVQLFDVLVCKNMSDFDAYIPGVTPVYQTPVVGVWENGILTQKASGAGAKHLLRQRFGLEK